MGSVVRQRGDNEGLSPWVPAPRDSDVLATCLCRLCFWKLFCSVGEQGLHKVQKKGWAWGVTGLLCQADHSWMEPEPNLQASHRMMTQEILELMDSSPFPGQENRHTRAKKEGQCAPSTLAPSVSLSSVHGVWCGSW